MSRASHITGPKGQSVIRVIGSKALSQFLDTLGNLKAPVYIHYISREPDPRFERESLIKITTEREVLFNNLRDLPVIESEKIPFAKFLNTTVDSAEFQKHFFDTFQRKKYLHQINSEFTMGVKSVSPEEEAFNLFEELLNVQNAKALSCQSVRFFKEKQEDAVFLDLFRIKPN